VQAAAAKERQRIAGVRRKIEAAITIQLAWRRFVRRNKQKRNIARKIVEPKFANNITALKVGDDMWKMEIAALTIQLAWRQVCFCGPIGICSSADAGGASAPLLPQPLSLHRRTTTALFHTAGPIAMLWPRHHHNCICRHERLTDIVLIGRQFVRQRLLKKAAARQRVLNEWSPSVRANLRQQRVYQVYNTTVQKQIRYRPAELKPPSRPAYMRAAVSHAGRFASVAGFRFCWRRSSPLISLRPSRRGTICCLDPRQP